MISKIYLFLLWLWDLSWAFAFHSNLECCVACVWCSSSNFYSLFLSDLDFIVYDEWGKARNSATKIVDWVPFLEAPILQKKWQLQVGCICWWLLKFNGGISGICPRCIANFGDYKVKWMLKWWDLYSLPSPLSRNMWGYDLFHL